jgi:hypothetical protein
MCDNFFFFLLPLIDLKWSLSLNYSEGVQRIEKSFLLEIWKKQYNIMMGETLFDQNRILPFSVKSKS